MIKCSCGCDPEVCVCAFQPYYEPPPEYYEMEDEFFEDGPAFSFEVPCDDQ